MLSKKTLLILLTTASFTAFLASCGTTNAGKYYDRDGPPLVGGQLRAMNASDVNVKVEKPHKAANRPYTVMGKRYYPITGDKPMTQVGTASWYGKQFHGKKTSIGETYNMYELTAAHPTMELPSFAKVTNLKNGRSIIVRVNDRGPFLHGRIIDLSYAAAIKLGYQKEGTTRVKVERITRADIAKGKIPSTNSSGFVLAAVVSGVKSLTNSTTNADKVNNAISINSKTQTSDTFGSTNTSKSAEPNAISEYLNVSRETVSVPQTKSTTVSPVALPVDTSGDLIVLPEDKGEPSVSLSFSIEDANSTAREIIPKNPLSTAGIPLGTPGDKITSKDAIGALLAEEQQTNSTPNQTPLVIEKQEKRAIGVWGIQLGAYSVEDNARAWAAHAENLLDQENIGPVTIVQSGSIYKILVGQVSSQQEAAKLAQQISEKLGTKAIAVERKEPTD